jgi:thiol-disulfide isomerase/thioredoxin
VVIDFFSLTCGPCVRFKPTFESAARGNKNKHVVFCTVDCDNARDAATAHNIRSIPQIEFFYQGKEHAKFTGADEVKFRKHLSEVHELTMSKAGHHMGMNFKRFKPMNRKPIDFISTNNLDKMKEFITKLVNQSAGQVKVNHLQGWLSSFDVKKMNNDAIDQLVSLFSSAEDKSKIALIDLMRLIVLEGSQCEYIINKHWKSLVETAVIAYIEKTNMKDQSAKFVHNYHKASFMFLANIYSTDEGRTLMEDTARGQTLIQFCTRSFLSCNLKTV